MYRGAIQAILSELNRQGRLKVVESFSMDKPSTKGLIEKLQGMDAGRTLIVTENVDQNLFLSARNLPHVAVVDVAAMDPVSLIDAANVLITVDSVKKIEEWLA
jgi:large subunit ribosomal protein L4